MVRIRLVSYLKEVGGFKEKTFDVKGPTKIRDLIEFPELEERLLVLIDEKGGSFDSEVHNDELVKILPVMGGG